MAALAVIAALGTALCLGYYLGRRAGSRPTTWKRRTSRIALGRLAINLLVLVAARRVLALKIVEPLGLLRGGVARLR
ncbi:hypothetical protein AWB91_10690 [Mycobacterium paraense]|uniref:Uncharacterized protein n=1 Tax=Mycobacterium paraense TaxID=767916 RepID=A0A1X2ADC8_9MYCO|nr:hypothetical protein [Mycobacterium paraense]ORW32423.1 hypothetical protein AWB91_10690 [Mycobacterium paraense]ORW35993.1 hypothetical protein AWB88_25690 [Mycobacterium paraense]ORW49264.1 hypothetical protein AWB90_10260 [Mycobacterium paraense]